MRSNEEYKHHTLGAQNEWTNPLFIGNNRVDICTSVEKMSLLEEKAIGKSINKNVMMQEITRNNIEFDDKCPAFQEEIK